MKSPLLVSALAITLVAWLTTPAANQTPAYRAPRTADGKPDLNGIWQALNEANYDIQLHMARPALALRSGPYGPVPAAPLLALGAVVSVPPGLGVVEGETLVVDVTGFNDQTWFDRAGNFHSDALHVVERYTRTSPDVISYEATIEDSKVFTRPWKMSMPLYRRQEKNAQIMDFKCVEFVEELIYGKLRKTPLNK